MSSQPATSRTIYSTSRQNTTPPATSSPNSASPTSVSQSKPARSPVEPHSPAEQQALDAYRDTAGKHPDALGSLLTHVLVKEFSSVFRLQKKVDDFLGGSEIDLREIEDARKAFEIKNVSLKHINLFGHLEYQLRKHQATNPAAKRQLPLSSTSAQENIPAPGLATGLATGLAPGLAPGRETISNPDPLLAMRDNPTGWDPSTLPMNGATEDLLK